MNMWKSFVGGAAVMLLASSIMAETVMLEEKFDSPSALSHWVGTGATLASGDGDSGSCCVKFDIPKGNTNRTIMIDKALDISKFRGKKIHVEAMMKGKDLSWNGVSYFGPKLMIYIKTPTKQAWPDQRKASGDFDWLSFSVDETIPADVQELKLVIGLQECEGTLWIDNLKITSEP